MRRYIETLRKDNELVDIYDSVSRRFEVAAAAANIYKRSNKAVLFHNVRDSQIPIASNLYASRKSLARGLAIKQEELLANWKALCSSIDDNLTLAVESMCKEKVIETSIDSLPIPTYSEKDAAPYLTSAIFAVRDPVGGQINLSFHRTMLKDRSELLPRIGSTRYLAKVLRQAHAVGKSVEAAILIGVPLPVYFAAAVAIPENLDDLKVVARLSKKNFFLRQCRHIDLLIPSETEIVIEGVFLPNKIDIEGPFGEYRGYYSKPSHVASFSVINTYMRPESVFHSVNCGGPEEMLFSELSTSSDVYQSCTSVLSSVLDVRTMANSGIVAVQLHGNEDVDLEKFVSYVSSLQRKDIRMWVLVDSDVDIDSIDDVMWAIHTRGFELGKVRAINSKNLADATVSQLVVDATVPSQLKKAFERKRMLGV